MQARFVGAAVLIVVGSGLQAQDLKSPKCPGGPPLSSAQVAQDACQQAYDVYQFLSPQLGLALTGGNATAGQGGVLGGVGHFSVGLRGNGFSGLLPDFSNPAFTPRTGGATPARTLPTTSHVLGLPTADAAIGLFRGLPLSLTYILGVDALLSASYVPDVNESDVSVSPHTNWQFGYGVRVGLLSESIVTPGVSVTWIERDLPTTDITASSNNNRLQVLDAKVKTNAWRVVASKNLVMFGIAAGAGRDHYDQSATVTGAVSGILSGTATAPGTNQSLDRTNIFADLSWNLPLFKIVGEIGQASGGTVQTYNSFAGGRADRSQVYGSLGLRLSK